MVAPLAGAVVAVPLKDDLEALYAEIPAIACKRLCVDSCGPIAASAGEGGRMFALTDIPLRLGEDLRCGYLNKRGLCAVYDVRPVICRLYGVVDDHRMRCPHGCEPERWLSNAEARAMIRRAYEIGGPTVYTVDQGIEGMLFELYGARAPGFQGAKE